MKTLFFALSIILLAVSAQAAPFLVCDALPGADYFELTIDGATVKTDAVNSAIRYDMAGISTGTHTVTARGCSNVWGCGETSSPFVFTRPSLSGTPGNLRLSQ